MERILIFTSMKTNKVIQYILSLLTFVALVYFVIKQSPNSELRYDLYYPYLDYIFSGFLWTILISILVFVFSFLLGGLMFFSAKSKIPYFRYITKHFTMFMFGSPLLVVVIVFYFFIGGAFGVSNKLFLGLLSLSLYFAPFVMKLYQSAYESIDKKQILVCDMFGFSKRQMYQYIIFPQMIRIMLPPLSGHLATVIKSSSLLYLISFRELYYTITTVQTKNYTYTEGYILMVVLYLIITIPLLKLSNILEKRIKL